MIEADNPYLLIPQLDHPVLRGRSRPVFPGPLRRESRPFLSPRPGSLGFRPVILLPFFFAVLAAMNLGALMASRFLFPPGADPEIAEIPQVPASVPAGPFEGLSSAFLGEPEIQGDPVMDFFRNPETRSRVISFFEKVCGSLNTAQVILEEAERYSIPPSLAFALSWEESRFNYRAVNRKNRDGSVDRGLFQLNNRSFPHLGEAEFFDPRLNASYGMAHLRFCIDTGGSEIAALAMYNAGTGRVRSGGTPRQTLDYAARVLSSRRKIDRVFLEEWARRGPPPGEGEPPMEAAEAAAQAPKPRSFFLPILRLLSR